jgi:hypothetical protein
VLYRFNEISESDFAEDKKSLWNVFKCGRETDMNEMEKYIENEAENVPENSGLVR